MSGSSSTSPREVSVIVGFATLRGLLRRPHDPDCTGACIRVEDLAEWEPLDNRSILLSVPGQPRGHLITLVAPIEDLRIANDLEVIDGDLNGFICADGVDQVFAAECSCSSASIASIKFLSEKRTAELLREGPTIL
jgi:hypothetical protein